MITAVAHPLRLRVIGALADGRVHVSELARRLGMSRPLLYMHLDRLEKAGIVTGHLELSEDGKAMKYFELTPFELRVTADTIVAALRADEAAGVAESDGVAGAGGRKKPDREEGDNTMGESDR
jgi:DNA-binding transcriptional ArsR family regulator